MKQTPSQTVGPYFAYGLAPEQYLYNFKQLVNNVLYEEFQEDSICIMGQVFDGEGVLIPDALIEIWQIDEHFQAFGRHGTGTNPANKFIFYTKKPKSINGQAPFITVVVLMRGQLIHSYTRIYFEDETLNETDEVLNAVPKDRKHTLLAKKESNVYTFNINMQGENETIFFDI